MRSWSARLLAAVMLAVAVLSVTAGFAAAQETAGLVATRVTLNNTSGGSLTRFTFVADTTVQVDALELAFPKSFDLSEMTLDVVTLEGLTRVPASVSPVVEGTTVRMTFSPSISPSSTLRVQLHDVLLPNVGGTKELGVTYVSGGTRSTLEPPLTFTFETVTRSEQLSRWLDRQAWVTMWNRVKLLDMFAQPQKIALAVPLLFVGWLTSIGLVLFAFPLAIIGGLALAFARMSKIVPLRWVAGIYINVIRGTPLFLQIYFAYVGLPIAGIRAPLLITGVIVLALNSSAYLAEIFRAGIQSISRGQFEAASSLGMTYWQAMRYVIVPQTVKRVLPTMTSEFILLFKDTALLSAVGVFELMLYANSLATRSGNLTPFVVAAVYYLMVTIPLINWVASLERKLAISEGGQAASSPRKKRYWWKGAPPEQGEALPPTPAQHESR